MNESAAATAAASKVSPDESEGADSVGARTEVNPMGSSDSLTRGYGNAHRVGETGGRS